METARKKFETVNEYLKSFPPATRRILKELRNAILEVAPGAEEVISYNIPAFKLNGMLVWYAGYQHHIGLYPKSSVIALYKKELTDYQLTKGTIQFPLDKPLPLPLIKKIVKQRMKENLAGLKKPGKSK